MHENRGLAPRDISASWHMQELVQWGIRYLRVYLRTDQVNPGHLKLVMPPCYSPEPKAQGELLS